MKKYIKINEKEKQWIMCAFGISKAIYYFNFALYPSKN